MSEIDDIDGEGDAGSGDSGSVEPLSDADASALVEPGVACLSCGAGVAGIFCVACGQKQDDLRRSLFVLARDFVEDTFAFDSRMWRTLGLLAASPGVVPTNYSHGKRSRYTPPVRLFLVVSFLFFLVIGVTNTLFVGLEVRFTETDRARVEQAIINAGNAGIDISDAADGQCSFSGDLRFLVQERDLKTDKERLDACVNERRIDIERENAEAERATTGDVSTVAVSDDERELIRHSLDGVNWAISNPRAFNNAFNDWLPRVMFFMAPVLALILSLFLRRDAIIFDHMVLSLYVHAVNFAIVGVSLLLAQIGAPLVSAVSTLVIVFYYVIALKRAYKRGWVKTIWTAFMSGAIYLFLLLSILVAIMTVVVLKAPV